MANPAATFIPYLSKRGHLLCPCHSFGRTAELHERRFVNDAGVVNYYCDNGCRWQLINDGQTWHYLGGRQAE